MLHRLEAITNFALNLRDDVFTLMTLHQTQSVNLPSERRTFYSACDWYVDQCEILHLLKLRT